MEGWLAVLDDRTQELMQDASGQVLLFPSEAEAAAWGTAVPVVKLAVDTDPRGD